MHLYTECTLIIFSFLNFFFIIIVIISIFVFWFSRFFMFGTLSEKLHNLLTTRKSFNGTDLSSTEGNFPPIINDEHISRNFFDNSCWFLYSQNFLILLCKTHTFVIFLLISCGFLMPVRHAFFCFLVIYHCIYSVCNE